MTPTPSLEELRGLMIMRLAATMIRDHAGSIIVRYDDADCDGYCLADDLETEVQALLDRLADAERERDAGCCDGCGSTKTIEQIRAAHPNALSCCPERKMLSAEQWRTRALTAEKRLEQAVEVVRGFAAMADELERIAAQHVNCPPSEISRRVDYHMCAAARQFLDTLNQEQAG